MSHVTIHKLVHIKDHGSDGSQVCAIMMIKPNVTLTYKMQVVIFIIVSSTLSNQDAPCLLDVLDAVVPVVTSVLSSQSSYRRCCSTPAMPAEGNVGKSGSSFKIHDSNSKCHLVVDMQCRRQWNVSYLPASGLGGSATTCGAPP